MTQLALTSKDFFFSSHYMLKRLFFVSALKVLSKFYKLILARGFKKRLQRPATSFFFSPRFSLFLRFFSPSLANLGKTTQNKRYTGYVSHFSRSIVVYYITHTQVPLPSLEFVRRRTRRTSGIQMQKETRDKGWRGAEIHRRGGRGECGRRNRDVD